ncbi:MAG: hypothetical protein ABGX69_00770 [Methylococcales bacterium]|jgi:hypothetical protein|nr:hypothetical protein [Methylococcaceae bacterium]HIL41673.1 hypothetical protein [Methylococcales bacterium]
MLKKSLFYWGLVFVLSGVGSAEVFAAKKYPASDFNPVVIYQNDEIKKNALQAQNQGAQKASISTVELLLGLGFLGFIGFLFKSTPVSTVSASELTTTDPVEDVQVVDNIADITVDEEVVVTEEGVPADNVVETTPVVVAKRKRYGYQGR